MAGDVLKGTIEIDNPQSIQIKRVVCTIEQRLQVEGDSVIDRIVDMTLSSIPSSTENHLEGAFEISIPDNLPPTFVFNEANVRGQHPRINVRYEIKFEVCVVGLLADFSVIKPLRIAIDPWKHENDGTITLIDRTQSDQ